MKHRRNLFRTQCLGRQEDLPQSGRATALTQGGFGSIDQRTWEDLEKRSRFCFIDECPICAGNHEIDFDSAKIRKDAFQKLFRFIPFSKISTRVRALNRKCSLTREHDCSRTFAQNRSAALLAERLNRRRRTQQTPSAVSIA